MNTDVLNSRDLQIIENDNEPRVLDVRLAERLEFKRLADIRELIERNRAELERYGIIRMVRIIHVGAGRPGFEYWLNEAQALVICMKSDAQRAADVRYEVITVFLAWRSGQTSSIPVFRDLFAPVTRIEDAIDQTHGIVIDIRDYLKSSTASMRCESIEIKSKLDRNLEAVFGMSSDVAAARRELERIQIRKTPKAEDIYQHTCAIRKFCHGKCPRCMEIQILDADNDLIPDVAELDHRFGRGNVALWEFWYLCKKCHDETHPSRGEDRLAFDAYIERVKSVPRYSAIEPYRHKSKQGKDTNDNRTNDMFEK
jgi:hypothetical protein